MGDGPGSVSAPEPSSSSCSAAAAAPAPPPEPLKPSISRYRSLRGRSVSSLRPFDIFRHSSSTAASSCSSNTDRTLSASSSTVDSSSHDDDERRTSQTSGLLHRRGKTLTAARPPPLPDFAPTPVLSPRPVNATLKPSLTALESLDTPAESVREALLKKAAASANRRAAAAATPSTAPAEAADQEGRKSREDRIAADQTDRKRDGVVSAVISSPPLPPPPPAAAPLPTREPPPPPREPLRGPPPPPREPSRAQQHDNKDEAALLAARLEAETDRILAEQKKLDLARLQAQLVTPPSKPSRRPLLDSFAFLSRGRRPSAKNPSQPSTPSTIAPSIFSPDPAASSVFSRRSSIDASLRMSFIEPGGRGIVPQFDAPASAINGGQRRVIVRCLSSTITLPFTAETSPVDIVVASAEKTNHVITPTTCIVIECYFMLGLERRLRRYERVRDVLNSWDNDEQNSLLILPCDSPKDDRGLDLGSVPRTDDPPSGFCVQLHHSARPGKWSKRWITLLESGQIFASKRADVSPLDKDSVALCHLSDFDIYSPKESEMRRNLKPPKRFCYAIKSQQKTHAFPNGENFVHFFCTDDDKLASRFYDLVHGWRSWYLANRLVDLERKEKPPQITHSPLLGVKPPRNAGKGSEKGPRVSIDETAYRSEEPLMDVSGFKVPDVPLIDTTLTGRSSKDSPRSKGATSPRSETTEKEREFFAGGLLGDAYDKRKQDEVANTQTRGRSARADGPFTEGPSLLNGGVSGAAEGHERSEPKSWFPSAAEHSARVRSQSGHPVGRRPMTADAAAQLRREKQQQQQQPPQPLLTFGKEFPEPPRFRDAHGGGIRHATGQPLINFATGGAPPLPGAPPQLMSRRAASGPSAGGSMAPPSARGRSRSTAGLGPTGGGRRFSPEELPPVPPLPNRPVRRDRFGEAHHGNGPSARPPEPLVNRAR